MATRMVTVIEEDLTCIATGQRMRLETRKVPTLGPDGEIIGVLGVARDITELSRLENELVHRERAFRSLVENSPDAIARYNTDSRCVYGNPAMKSLTGLDDAGLFGKKPSEMPQLSGNAGKTYLALLEHVIANGRPGTVELQWENNGQAACMQLRIAPEFDARGRIISILAIGRDILTLKQAEQRLRESRDRLRHHARHREDVMENERRLLSRQIHEDLAQNLSALRLRINLLETQAGPQVPIGAFEGLRAVVDQCMAQSRHMATSLRPSVLDMGISTALHWLSDKFFQDSGITVKPNVPENLRLDDDYTTYLFRAAQEALSNIVQHARASEVSLTLRAREQHIVLRICDNGQGFDREALSQEKTFGLFWMQEQALQLGGALQIVSSPEKGTIIDIRLVRHH
jgi:PAS domain S-box-containing protein